MWSSVAKFLIAAGLARAAVNSTQDAGTVTISSDRLTISVNKTMGAMTGLEVDGVDVLGPVSGRIGMGYFDCYCVPSINATAWSPDNPNPQSSRHYYVGQSKNASFEILQGTADDQTPWIGLVMSETYAITGQAFQQWWFLRDGETGYHSFTRLTFDNGTEGIDLGNVQEFRQVISPNTPIWTHLVTNQRQYAHLPSKAAIANQRTVQDATWYYNVTEGNPYVAESSDYFTKYQYADLYGDHRAHGFYADGSGTNGTTMGFWQVFNSYEGYTGGPLRSDLVVDTNIYNYYLSNHRGSSTLNLTSGFARTFGPSFVYFNRDGEVKALLADAESKADPSFAADFYDDVAEYIPGFVSSAGRGTFNAKVDWPQGAGAGKAVLSEIGRDFQDNVGNASVYQYWANVSSDGMVSIPRVVAGEYRLTIYADGVFGQFEQDGVMVQAGDGHDAPYPVQWTPETHGAELFRLGVPDKTAGEYRHGFAPDPNRTNHQEEYRQYWGVWDFPTDFPQGVNYTIGKSDPGQDWNYVHYSRYGGTRTRPEYVIDNVNVWTINWTPDAPLSVEGKNATFTVQLAGVRTASGNTDLVEASSNYSNVDYTLDVNGNELVWTIPHNVSSSCTDRNGIACYNVRHLFEFPGDWLNNDTVNTFKLALPYNASGGDVNFRNYSISVVYDALRLEISE